jgi:hypothetical protein
MEGRIDDVKAIIRDCKGEYLFFILYITEGKFDVLECFTTLDSWKDNYNVLIEYCYEDARRFKINQKEIIIEGIQ